MYIAYETLDDLMHHVLDVLLRDTTFVEASKGRFTELYGVCLHLKNPRARLSRSEGKGKIFSALGELLWYLSKDTRLDFIDYYIPNKFQKESDDQVQVRGGYGDRLFSFRGIDQVGNVIRQLSEKSSSRRAVIQLFDASDLVGKFASVPCTCTLQFLARDGRLNMFVSMRSNDAFVGLPHDVFAFTMLQEMIARSTGHELGEYKHCAGSLHLYEYHRRAAYEYLKEGWQSTTIVMPAMPNGSPWDSIKALQRLEEGLRNGDEVDVQAASLDPYWEDLAWLLKAWRAGSKDKNKGELIAIKDKIHSDVYKMFIQPRIDRLPT